MKVTIGKECLECSKCGSKDCKKEEIEGAEHDDHMQGLTHRVSCNGCGHHVYEISSFQGKF